MMVLNNAIAPHPPKNHDSHNQILMQQALGTVIDKGMPLMINDLSEEQLSIWLDFSKEMLRVTAKDTASYVYINYLQLILTLMSTKLTPYQKLYHCLQYLLEIMKVVLA